MSSIRNPKSVIRNREESERRRSQILGMIIIAILVLLIASIRFYFKLA